MIVDQDHVGGSIKIMSEAIEATLVGVLLESAKSSKQSAADLAGQISTIACNSRVSPEVVLDVLNAKGRSDAKGIAVALNSLCQTPPQPPPAYESATTPSPWADQEADWFGSPPPYATDRGGGGSGDVLYKYFLSSSLIYLNF